MATSAVAVMAGLRQAILSPKANWVQRGAKIVFLITHGGDKGVLIAFRLGNK